MSKSATPDALGTERTLRSSRNPRRRPRPESDSVKVAPRRKRSKISENTFLPRDGTAETDGEDIAMNGHAGHAQVNGHKARKPSGSLALGEIDIPVRGARGTVKRTARADGTTTLTQNGAYTVKSLPSTPKELKKETLEYRSSLCVNAGLAIAVTRQKALIWDFVSHSHAGGARTLDVPFAVKSNEPVPFGVLVTGGNATDTGVLLVSATSGKAVYHESIERVTSMGLFQERKDGVEGTISGLFSGETLLNIVPAYSAGFILVLSSGRLVHLALRDAQGKPKLQSQILYTSEQTAGGILGSLKGLLGGSIWKHAVSVVHTRSLERGQVQAIALAERGELRIWDLDWSGRYDYRGSVDFREVLLNEVKHLQSAETQGHVQDLAILDFAILERPHGSNNLEIATLSANKPLDLLLLVRVGPSSMQSYCLVDISLVGSEFDIRRVLEIRTYSSSGAVEGRPALLVPRIGHTAFVMLSDAVVVMSISGEGSDPEAQLHDASYIAPDAFEDTVYLRGDQGLAFTSAWTEDERSNKDASIVAFVGSAGLIRVIASDSVDNFGLTRIPVKSRIEQAIFYGTSDDNILDLSRRGPSSDSQIDIEHAALAISDEILRSTTPFIPIPPTSIDANLTRRGQALNALATHLKTTYPSLSRKTMWQLLSDAEKIAACNTLWPMFEAHLANASKIKKRSTLLHEISEWMQQAGHFEPLWDRGGPDDRVRTMFVTQLPRIEKVLPWARQILQHLRDDGQHSSGNIVRLVSEADDIWLLCLESVFEFRAANAADYGISPATIEEGIPTDPAEAQEVAEFWTSTDVMLKEVVKLTTLSRDAAEAAYETDEEGSANEFIAKIAQENPRLVQLCCLIYRERIVWCQSRGSAKYHDQAKKLQAAYEAMRYQQTRALAEVGQVQAGMKLAEKYHDMHTLTEIVVGETQYLLEHRATMVASEATVIDAKLEEMNKRVTRYFDTYGDEWSEAFFGEGFASGQAGTMLQEGQAKWSEALTKYLRSDPSRSKTCWLNDITHDHDFGHAVRTLTSAAKTEDNVWSKKVDWSLAKLATLAEQEDDVQSPVQLDALTANADKQLKIVDVQQRLYRHVLPEILHCIDLEAEIQVAMEKFSPKIGKIDRVFRRAMAKLLMHKNLDPLELIDLLTLMNSVATTNEETDLHGLEPFEALQVLDAAPPMKPKLFDILLRIIWKRAFSRNDWVEINAQAAEKSESEIRQYLSRTSLYRTTYAAIDKALISATPDTQIRLLDPADTIGAGSESGVLSEDYPTELVEEVLRENARTDTALQESIDNQRTEGWWADIVKYVYEDIEAAAEAERQGWAEESLVEVDGINGHTANGLPNGIKIEEDDGDNSALYNTDDGDVEMA